MLCYTELLPQDYEALFLAVSLIRLSRLVSSKKKKRLSKMGWLFSESASWDISVI